LKRSNRLVLLIGIFLALVAFVLVVILLGGNGPGGTGSQQPSASPTITKYVIAITDIPLGAKIQAEQVGLQDIAIKDRPADSYGATGPVIGARARQAIAAGQYISTAALNDTGSLKTLEVPAGLVGMAVRVNQVSGVGTLIKAGDYVDAVVGFRIKPTNQDPTTGELKEGNVTFTSVKALLQGMQVLGTLLPAPTKSTTEPQPSSSASTGGSTDLNDQDQIVILAVTLQQAEVLNYSQIDGFDANAMGPNGITLVLRSSADYADAAGSPSIPPDVLTTGVVLRLLIEQYGVLPPDAGHLFLFPTPAPSRRP
jgi:Flp pilus assembly protein CpaB